MISDEDRQLNWATSLLKGIANPLRLQIIWLLDLYGELNSLTIAGHLQVESAQLNVYLNHMRNKGLLTSRRHSKEVYFSLADPAVGKIVRLLLKQ